MSLLRAALVYNKVSDAEISSHKGTSFLGGESEPLLFTSTLRQIHNPVAWVRPSPSRSAFVSIWVAPQLMLRHDLLPGISYLSEGGPHGGACLLNIETSESDTTQYQHMYLSFSEGAEPESNSSNRTKRELHIDQTSSAIKHHVGPR